MNQSQETVTGADLPVEEVESESLISALMDIEREMLQEQGLSITQFELDWEVVWEPFAHVESVNVLRSAHVWVVSGYLSDKQDFTTGRWVIHPIDAVARKMAGAD